MNQEKSITIVAEAMIQGMHQYFETRVLSKLSPAGKSALHKMVEQNIIEEADMARVLSYEEQIALSEELDLTGIETYMGETLFEDVMAQYPSEMTEAVHAFDDAEGFHRALQKEMGNVLQEKPMYAVVYYFYKLGGL
jgi:hypothetical protein